MLVAGADIIVLTVRFDWKNEHVEKATKIATSNGKIIFAPEMGFLEGQSQVIAVHAVDGFGDNLTGNFPRPDQSFTAVGIGLTTDIILANAPDDWKSRVVIPPPPSVAAVTAASIAADILEFARWYWSRVDMRTHEDLKWLFSSDGMRELLRLISADVNGHLFVDPSVFCPRGPSKFAIETLGEMAKLALRKKKK